MPEDNEETITDGITKLELNAKDEEGKEEEGKKKRKRNRSGKKKQTDPPSLPVSVLFPDGMLS